MYVRIPCNEFFKLLCHLLLIKASLESWAKNIIFVSSDWRWIGRSFSSPFCAKGQREEGKVVDIGEEPSNKQ